MKECSAYRSLQPSPVTSPLSYFPSPAGADLSSIAKPLSTSPRFTSKRSLLYNVKISTCRSTCHPFRGDPYANEFIYRASLSCIWRWPAPSASAPRPTPFGKDSPAAWSCSADSSSPKSAALHVADGHFAMLIVLSISVWESLPSLDFSEETPEMSVLPTTAARQSQIRDKSIRRGINSP